MCLLWLRNFRLSLPWVISTFKTEIWFFFSNLDQIFFSNLLLFAFRKSRAIFSHTSSILTLVSWVVSKICCLWDWVWRHYIPLSNTSVSQVLQWRVSLPQSLLGFEEHRSIDEVFNLKQDRRYSKARNG